MESSTSAGFALVLVGYALLALGRPRRRRELVALCISALAGLELGVGYGMPHGDLGLRRIIGGATEATLLSCVCALCMGVVQAVGAWRQREATPRSELVAPLVLVAMPVALFCAWMVGLAIRGRLLHW